MRLPLTLALTGVLAGAACERTEPRAPLVAFHEDLTRVLERAAIPGLSVAVARDGRVLWSHGYGMADPTTGREATARTPYRVASIAKTMTATVLLRLEERGDLDLDAPVARYLDAPPDWARAVTVRHVLSHTSEGPEPGVRFVYSGRYDVLGAVAEIAAGRPFAELLEELVFEPAGMTASRAVDRLGTSWLADALATPNDPDGRPAPGIELPQRATGGNGVVSTVEDLTRFVDALAQGRLLEPEAVEAAWTPTSSPDGALPYGLGWFVESTPTVDLVWHGGQWPVYSGLLLHVPRQGLTLAVLANAWHVSHPYYQIGTGTVLFNAIAASFLRHLVLDPGLGPVPEPQWTASADSLERAGRRLDGPVRYHWGAELFGRGLLAREAGDPGRADSLLAAAIACCAESLAASQDLGLLFHLGRSDRAELRRIGQRAGHRLLARWPEAVLPRFHLAVSLVQDAEGARATSLLESLIDDERAPAWLRGWSAFLLAEQVADSEPDRARALLQGVLDRGVDESGLLGEARSLLAEVGDDAVETPGAR